MPALFDRLLIEPRPEELIAALKAAGPTSRMVNPGKKPLVEHGPAILNAARAREGVYCWPAFTGYYADVAWWTDPLRRRHFRVRCGEYLGPPHDPLQVHEDPPRPPLWYVYPDRLFHRQRNGRSEWVAVCGCGVTGTPAALAWMGPCCGPCHDRREEGDPFPVVFRADVLSPGWGVIALAVTADGSTLAVGHGIRNSIYRSVTLVRVDTSEEQAVPLTCIFRETFLAPTFSPDGQLLAVGTSGSGLQLFSRSSREVRRLPTTTSAFPQVLFSPDGQTLVAVSADDHLHLWRQEGDWLPVETAVRAFTASFSPDGQTLAVGHEDRITLLAPAEGRWIPCRELRLGFPEGEEVSLVEFAHAGRTLLVLTQPGSGMLQAPLPKTGGLHCIDLSGVDPHGLGRLPGPSIPVEFGDPSSDTHWRRASPRVELPQLTVAAVSPDGAVLAWVIYDTQHSPAEVTFWDVHAGRELGRLEWDGRELIHDLTFFADGQTLATGGEWGTVKLWPWRRLLEG